MQRLVNYIKSLIEINDDDLNKVLENFSEKKLTKNSFLLKKGQIASFYYFVASGALRIITDKEPNDKTMWISLENEFIAELPSIKYQEPSNFYFQAIEDTTIFTIEATKMDQLYNEINQWQAFGRQVWEKAFMRIVNDTLLLKTENATERYKKAVLQTEYIRRVPLKYLSSYLGITQSSLSRLRKNIK